jgi:quinol monooxygenase YgiN
MLCLAVTYHIRPGHESDAVRYFYQLTKATRQEPGCRMYQAHQSTSDPLKFFLYEQYDDQTAVDAHRESGHFEVYVKNGLFTILESRVPEMYRPLDG